MDGLIHYGVQVGAKSSRVDPRCPPRGVGDHSPGYEPAGRDGTELSHGHAVTGYDERPTRLHLSEHRTGIVTQFPLRYRFVHVSGVAYVAFCSNIA